MILNIRDQTKDSTRSILSVQNRLRPSTPSPVSSIVSSSDPSLHHPNSDNQCLRSNSSSSSSSSQSSSSSSSSSSSQSPSSSSSSSWNLLITITLSASLTLLNKSIYTDYNYPFPFHLLALHFASISLASRVLASFLRPKELKSFREKVSWSFWFSNVLTVGLAYGSAILCSNVAYLMLSVSFVQMLKAFTPVILVFFNSLIEHRLPPVRTASVVLTISTGVAIAAYGEIHFVFLGALFQLLGSLAEVGRLIATQRLLQDLCVDPIVALSALSPICCAMALVLAPFFEGFEPIFLIVPRLGYSMILFSIAIALSLNIVVLFLVSSTNALVLTLAGIVKDICLILGSVVFLKSKITAIQIFGYGISALGLIYFKFTSTKSNNSGQTTHPTTKHLNNKLDCKDSFDRKSINFKNKRTKRDKNGLGSGNSNGSGCSNGRANSDNEHRLDSSLNPFKVFSNRSEKPKFFRYFSGGDIKSGNGRRGEVYEDKNYEALALDDIGEEREFEEIQKEN